LFPFLEKIVKLPCSSRFLFW